MVSNLPCPLWVVLLLFVGTAAGGLHLYLYLLYREKIADCLVHRGGIVRRFLLGRVYGYISSILFGVAFVFSLLLLVASGHKTLYWFALFNSLAVVLLYRPLRELLLSETYPDVGLYLISKYLPWAVLLPSIPLYGFYTFSHLPLGEIIPTPDAVGYEKHLSEVYLRGFSCKWVGLFFYLVKVSDYAVWSLQMALSNYFPSGFKVFSVYLLLKEGFSVWAINGFLAKLLATLDARRL